MKNLFEKIRYFISIVLLIATLCFSNNVSFAEEESLSQDPSAQTTEPIQNLEPIGQPTQPELIDKNLETQVEDPALIQPAPQALQQITADPVPDYKDERRSFKTVVAQADPVNGALVLSYPITVPPGRNGMQPSLSLDYNSQNTDNINIFGYGWSINIPYIERVNKLGTNRIYTDNFFSSSLDGELKPITLSDLSHGLYGSKIESGNFLNYTFNSENYWEVYDKNGTKYTFGSFIGFGNQLDPNNGVRTYRWFLVEMRDSNDNFIKYEYSLSDQGQIYPSKIKYTGSGSTDGIFTVEFFQADRNDKITSFSSGFEVVNKNLINQIVVSVDGTWVREYDLSYAAGDNGYRSMLDSITESGCSEDGTGTVTLNAERFDYLKNAANQTWSYNPSGWWSNNIGKFLKKILPY